MGITRLDTALFEALGAKNVFLKRLEKLGIKTVGELLRHFPARYDDFSRIVSIAELSPGEEATVQGVVRDVDTKYTHRRGMTIVEAVIEDDTGSIRAVWFNQPYIAGAMRIGRAVSLAGKVSLSDSGELYLSHPAHEAIPSTDLVGQYLGTQLTGALIPIYPETRGLTSRGIRYLIGNILKRKIALDEWIPEEILAAQDLPPIADAFSNIHFPETIEDALAAKRRFLFEDLFLLNLVNLKQKLALASESAPEIPTDLDHLRAVLGELPFALTPSQKRSLWEVIQDIAGVRPMNRLLQGDVGSGKTIVAALAALMAAGHGFQTAFMAPTEILARQHFETFQKFFGTLPSAEQPAIGLITAGSATVAYEHGVSGKIKKEDLWRDVAHDKIAIVFGTHTLIQKSAKFHRLGFIIVDEQHRFGVKQRAALLQNRDPEKPNSEHAKDRSYIPHFLSMSATPIPRTLMMTVFGDLDVSLITELPAGRQPVETKIVLPLERTGTYAFIKKQVKAGRQAFVICPRIEAEEKEEESGTRNPEPGGSSRFAIRDSRFVQKSQQVVELKSVKEEYEKLSKKIFPDLRVAMLHGQMKAKEKEEIMKKFAAGEIDILVSTSVIEVGVDIPNATIMMIEGADRFGLAQLYQFRGRVGRGAHQSYCFLLTDSAGDATKARLQAIMTAKNGFELAERDLALRGPGQFFGDEQSGLPDVAMEALRDEGLVKAARDAAVAVMQTDASLKYHPPLREKLDGFRRQLHQE
jgi:ATP-dependent DNA helicase RecG